MNKEDVLNEGPEKFESNKTPDPKLCDHEPDPSTLVYDKKLRRKRAICIRCGHPISVTKYYRRPGDPSEKVMKITSSDRREAKRRNYNDA